ncbi:MAG: hypothetical protein RL311_15 [Bacteroidota bacterium]
MAFLLKHRDKVFILCLFAVLFWLVKNYQYQKSENKRQTENARQLHISDSTRFTAQILNQNELKEYLEHNNSELEKKLLKSEIKQSRIKEIITTKTVYIDTTKKEFKVDKVLQGIKDSTSTVQQWDDTTTCISIKGLVSYDGKELKVIVTEKKSRNKSDAVAYWQRNQWRFLGIKTRFLGKKEFTSTVFDECGKSEVLRIEKK